MSQMDIRFSWVEDIVKKKCAVNTLCGQNGVSFTCSVDLSFCQTPV